MKIRKPFACVLLIGVLCWGGGQHQHDAYADQPGPYLDLRFSEGSGPVLNDHSGNNRQATIHGTQWTRSQDRNVLRFDGENDYLDGGAISEFDGDRSITLEAWVHPEPGPQATEMGLVGKSYGSFLLRYYTAGTCYFYLGSSRNYVTAPMMANQWHHVAGT